MLFWELFCVLLFWETKTQAAHSKDKHDDFIVWSRNNPSQPHLYKLAIHLSNLWLISQGLVHDEDLSSLDWKSCSIFLNGTVPHLWKRLRAPQTIRQGKALWPLVSHRQPRQERWLVQKGNYGASHNDTEEACVITHTVFYHSAVINYHLFTLWFIPLFITYSYIQEKVSSPPGINQKQEELVGSRWMIKVGVCLPRCVGGETLGKVYEKLWSNQISSTRLERVGKHSCSFK